MRYFNAVETRRALRRSFEVDAECITIATLSQLLRKGEFEPAQVQKAIQELGVDPEKLNPMRA